MQFIKSSIKAKLQISFFILILLSAIAGVFSYRTLKNIISHQELKSEIDEIVHLFAEVRRHEKDFILYDRKNDAFLREGISTSLEKHQLALVSIRKILSEVEANKVLQEQNLRGEVEMVGLAVSAYDHAFGQLVDAYKARGFKDFGLEGEMREYVHALQKCESKEEQWYALMLRRHEKDFFIRKDEKYVATLENRAKDFIEFVKQSELPHMTDSYKSSTVNSIVAYMHHFHRIVMLEKEIGLTLNDGIMGMLTRQAEQIEPTVAGLQFEINKRTSALVDNSVWIVLVSGGAMLAFGIILSLLLARLISRPIILLSSIIEKAKVGNEEAEKTLNSISRQDEIGKLVESFRNMFQEINEKVREVSEKNDVLEASAKKEVERNWFMEGVATFERIMMHNSSDLTTLCDQFLLSLAKYTKSAQAALFIKQTGEDGIEYMEMKTCYAMDKKRYVNVQFELGEGIIGAIWQEKDSAYITDVPEFYSKIRSGLGQAKPRAVFFTPIMQENLVEGVIEIAAFQEFSENERKLIEQAAKGLATSVARVRMQEQTNRLLGRANKLAEELKQSENEMRQNMNELHAAQEGLQHKNQEMEEKITSLNLKSTVFEKLVDCFYKGIVITNEEFQVIYLNEYINNLLGSSVQARQAEMIDAIFKTSLSRHATILQNELVDGADVPLLSFQESFKSADGSTHCMNIRIIRFLFGLESYLVFMFNPEKLQQVSEKPFTKQRRIDRTIIS